MLLFSLAASDLVIGQTLLAPGPSNCTTYPKQEPAIVSEQLEKAGVRRTRQHTNLTLRGWHEVEGKFYSPELLRSPREIVCPFHKRRPALLQYISSWPTLIRNPQLYTGKARISRGQHIGIEIHDKRVWVNSKQIKKIGRASC